MREIMRIAPLRIEPGLIAYECPACGKVTREIWPPERRMDQSDAPQAAPDGLGAGIDNDRPDYHVYCAAINRPGTEAAVARTTRGVRVLPEIEPFFHGVGFAIIGPQSLIAHGPGNCGLVVAGSAAGGCRARFAAVRGRL